LEHVFFGIFLVTTLAALTNVLGPVLGIGRLEIYGPCFVLIMAGFFAYAMVRYHLLELWDLIARTTLYGVLTSFVVLAFVLAISMVQWLFAADANADLLATAMAALIVAAGLHPLKERIQLGLDRWVMRRRYDSAALIEELSRLATSEIRLEGLLSAVSARVEERMGVPLVRILIAEDGTTDELSTAASTRSEDIGHITYGVEFLVGYLQAHPQPLLMEEVLQLRPGPERMRLATHLAELDAWLCAPLMSNRRLVGLMTLGQKDTRDIYTKEDVHVFASAGPTLAAAIENARLYRSLEGLNIHLERLLTNMRAGVVAVNAEGVVTTINRGACQLLGSIQAGQRLSELADAVRLMLERTLVESQGVTEFETSITGPDGRAIPVLVSTASLENDAGEPRGAMILLHDLTEMKRLESNVHRADRLSSLGTLAAGMAHEIKNPLVSIKTFGQLFLERYSDREYRETFAEIVPKEVDRIDSIVSRLLDFARPKPVKYEAQDVQAIMRHTLVLIENQTTKSGLRVHTQFLEKPKPVYGDEQQLHQVFLNLLLNSMEALQGRPNGEIHIKVLSERQHLQRRGGPPRADVECCKIIVSDTGCGIPPAQLDQIFTPFFTTKAAGSGLGLAVVYGILTEHGGSVDVSSVEGVGTVVTIALPVCEQPAISERVT
jgi:PAS domain S-box-containing protein